MHAAETTHNVACSGGVCQKIGLHAHRPSTRHQVGVEIATPAMILTGPGLRTRRRFLVLHSVATAPVEHLVGRGITAQRRNETYGTGSAPTIQHWHGTPRAPGLSCVHVSVACGYPSCSLRGVEEPMQGPDKDAEGSRSERERPCSDGHHLRVCARPS
jgi:hypothetical protein